MASLTASVRAVERRASPAVSAATLPSVVSGRVLVAGGVTTAPSVPGSAPSSAAATVGDARFHACASAAGFIPGAFAIIVRPYASAIGGPLLINAALGAVATIGAIGVCSVSASVEGNVTPMRAAIDWIVLARADCR